MIKPYAFFTLFCILLFSTVSSQNVVWSNVGHFGDAGFASPYNTIGADKDGHVTMVYMDYWNQSRSYAMRFNGYSWDTLGHQPFSDSALYVSLALSSAGVPYVAYCDFAQQKKMTVKKFDGVNWVTIGSAGFSPVAVFDCYIALNSHDVPYVVYSDNSSFGMGNPTVEMFNGSSWRIIGATSLPYTEVQLNCLAFDKNDRPYLAGQITNPSHPSGTTIVKVCNDTTWTYVGDSLGVTYRTVGSGSVCLQIHDTTLYLAYTEEIPTFNLYKTRVMRYAGNNWQMMDSVAFKNTTERDCSLALDTSGTPYILYSDSILDYATIVKKWDGNTWVTIGSPGFSGVFVYGVSLSISRNGTLFASYMEWDSWKHLRVKKYDACTKANTPTIYCANTQACAPAYFQLSLRNDSLNDNDKWFWYQGACGGTYLDSNFTEILAWADSATTFYVRGEGSCNTGVCASLRITNCAGIEEADEVSISLYPNPALDELTVRCDILAGTNITSDVYDLMGRLQKVSCKQELNARVFDTRGLSSGTYLIKIKVASFETTKRFIKCQ
jgi:hypothetical protein